MTTESPSRFAPLSRQAHAQLRFKPFTDWRFAAGEFMAPLAAIELPRAAGSYPLTFVRAKDHIEVVALLGLRPRESLMVGGNGEWLGGYVPASLRSRPFVIGVAKEGQSVLCVDEASPLISHEQGEGEAVFTEQGEMTERVQETAKFLRTVHASMMATWKACNALWQHNCLQPLKIPDKVETPLKQMKGLFQADEAALRALPAETLAQLMSLGAIGIAYAQMFSWHKLPALVALAGARASSEAPDLSVLERDGTLVLGSLGR